MINLVSRLTLIATLSCTLLALAACDRTTTATEKKPSVPHVHIDAKGSEKLWEIGLKRLQELNDSNAELKSSIERLLANPSTENLQLAQNNWHRSAEHTQELELFFLIGQYAPKPFNALQLAAHRLAATPIQPGYLDRFGPYPYSGIVHDIGVTLDRKTLSTEHQLTDNEEVLLGIFAIEYMLFGENDRRAEEYLEVTALSPAQLELGLQHPSELPSNRRRQLLELQIQQFDADTQDLTEAFSNSNEQNYANLWGKLEHKEQSRIFLLALETHLSAILVELHDLSDAPRLDKKSTLTHRLHSLQLILTATLPPKAEPATQALIKAQEILNDMPVTPDEQTHEHILHVYNNIKSAVDTLSPSA